MAGPAIRFIAVQDFEWVDGENVMGHYVKGLTYHAREGVAWDKLRTKIPEWVSEGKIELIGAAVGAMEGKGE